MEESTSEGVSGDWLKRLANWTLSHTIKTVLQVGPRSQNLRVLDLSQGFCPPLGVMQRPAILIMWHEYICLPIGLGFHSPVTLLVSQHRDANFLTSAAEKMNFGIVRGSTTRGGSSALRKLKEVAATDSIVITPDGPTGPRRVMNAGAVYLASLLQMPIVPVGIGFENPWRLKTWDTFAIPKPARRSRIIFGPTIDVPRKCSRETLDRYCQAVESDLNHVTKVAEDWAASHNEIEGAYRLGLRRSLRRTKSWFRCKNALHDQPVPEMNPATSTLVLDATSNTIAKVA